MAHGSPLALLARVLTKLAPRSHPVLRGPLQGACFPRCVCTHGQSHVPWDVLAVKGPPSPSSLSAGHLTGAASSRASGMETKAFLTRARPDHSGSRLVSEASGVAYRSPHPGAGEGWINPTWRPFLSVVATSAEHSQAATSVPRVPRAASPGFLATAANWADRVSWDAGQGRGHPSGSNTARTETEPRGWGGVRGMVQASASVAGVRLPLLFSSCCHRGKRAGGGVTFNL